VLGLAAASLILPLPYARVWAQTEGTLRLARLPKVALVVGNSRYKSVAELKNPANDARGVSAALQAAGFAVDLKLDASRAEMLEAIRAYAKTIGERKCVGLFYFAGHGLQLSWRNYLLPVDATIRDVNDVAAKGVDVATLIGGISDARNPMNVIILDACRDNPFAGVRVEQKGLSQMDAPPGTLLAYATAPGNVASDGDGENGLYTSNLLREMRVREAKIEDVFKRVRLAVRRQSQGRQIPWESTSLEEDFYFLPPEQLKQLSRKEEEIQFEKELVAFEAAKVSLDPGALLQEYLVAHPSGYFTELALLELDRVLARQGEKPIEIAPSAGNPNTAGTARADMGFKVGDEYVYRLTDRQTRIQRSQSLTVTAVTEGEVILNDGQAILDRLGNTILTPDGRRYSPRQDQPLEYAIGKKWSTRFALQRQGEDGRVTAHFKITARERVTVPAGTFDCFRVEGTALTQYSYGDKQVETSSVYWAAPGVVRRPVAREELRIMNIRGNRTTVYTQRDELVSFRQG
jgi:hypothetical protein